MPSWNYIQDVGIFLKKILHTKLSAMEEFKVLIKNNRRKEGSGNRQGANQEAKCSRQSEQQRKKPNGGKVSCI